MDSIEIVGGQRLSGEVLVSGAKNAALPLMAAALLGEGEHRLSNIPNLADIRTMGRLLQHMGCELVHEPEHESLTLKVPAQLEAQAPYELVKTMRASVLVLGPLVARLGHARVSLPGGCAIGARPIDQHLKGLAAMGADIRLDQGYVEASIKGRLQGTTVVLDMPTVTGTENLLMAATLAEGTTVLRNAAKEPEIVDLAVALQRMGAKIEGAGTPIIRIEGVESLGPLRHEVVADRIEAGTLAVAAAITQGNVLVRRCRPEHLETVFSKLREAGVSVEDEADGVRVKGPAQLKSVDFRTSPHPGFPTDMQAQLMALTTVAQGSSVIQETVFENRFMHVQELVRLGANIRVEGNTAVVKGVEKLGGAPVMATDLRASASLVVAGLRAEGITRVQRVYHLDRGYDGLELKLARLGAEIRRVRKGD